MSCDHNWNITLSWDYNRCPHVNSLARGSYRCICKSAMVKNRFVIHILSISCEISFRWTPLDLTDGESMVVPVMAWCGQATYNYMSQCSSRFMTLRSDIFSMILSAFSWKLDSQMFNNISLTIDRRMYEKRSPLTYIYEKEAPPPPPPPYIYIVWMSRCTLSYLWEFVLENIGKAILDVS